MKRAYRGSLFVIAGLVLAACHGGPLVFFKERQSEYRLAGTAPPLRVPEDLDGRRVQPLLVVPDIPQKTKVGSVLDPIDPKPQGLVGIADDQYVKIQKLGERHWLVVGEAPAVVWPRVKQYLTNNRVTLVADEPDAGRLESQWLELTDLGEDSIRRSLRKAAGDDSRAAKLFVKVEPGLREGSAEVHIRESSDVLSRTNWPEKSTLDTAEELLLNSLGEFLAADATDAAVSMRAQRIAGTTKTALEKTDSGEPLLVLRLDFDRAWATVGQAMAKAEINVTDLNRSTGLFYLQVSEAELDAEKPGFIKRWLSSGKPRKIALHMQARTAIAGVKPEVSSGSVAPESYALLVVPEKGVELPPDFAERLLLLIQSRAG